MITYRDFTPSRIKGGLLHSDRYERFDQAVVAANAWLEEAHVDLVTIETVVLPNVWSDHEEGTSDSQLETAEAMTSVNEWYQFVRVWYRA